MIEFVSKKLASGKRIQELKLLGRILTYSKGISKLLFAGLKEDLKNDYGIQMSREQEDNIVNIMTNEFPSGTGKNTYSECIFIERDLAFQEDYCISKSFQKMLENKDL